MVKLWQASRISGGSPFNYLDHTRAELDFILEKFAEENPKNGTFIRPGKVAPKSGASVLAEWSQVLVGRAKDAMMSAFTPSKAVLEAAARLSGRMRPTIVKGPAAKGDPKK